MPKAQPKNQAKARLRQLFAESGFSVSKETAERVHDFVTQFDPLRLYPDNWWDTWLKDAAPRRVSVEAQTPFQDEVSFEETVLTVMSRGFSYSIPTIEAVADIAKFVKDDAITEYMSGSGYWACLMRSWGVKIFGSDLRQRSYPICRNEPFIEMPAVDIQKAELPAKNAIMIAWPPHLFELMPTLKQMKTGQKLVYIDDPQCCATDSTHTFLEKGFTQVYERKLYGCYGRNSMRFFKRAR
jgi:hypothetical protein